MRAYSDSNEEALRARELLKDWIGEGLLTAEQYQRMEQETVCDLRRTNIFLRPVLFFFTLVIVGATVGLFLLGPGWNGILLIIFGVASYLTAEGAVFQGKLYRYGTEEALLACSVGFICAGMQSILSGSVLVPSIGAILSLWIWHRFGIPYAFPAAMLFIAWLPTHWTSYPPEHIIIAAIYASVLTIIATIRPRYRFTYLNERFSLAEAFLWLGIYLAINLQLASLGLIGLHAPTDFPRPFYWTTWVLTWVLPPIVLVRGLREKDRFVIIVGALVAILTLITNKPYLGWPRHTWDPMLLGALLIGVALFLRRWLANSPGGIRYGFTAQRLSGKDKTWISAGAATVGLLSPNLITPSPQAGSPDVHFGGGKSGGGGASSDF